MLLKLQLVTVHPCSPDALLIQKGNQKVKFPLCFSRYPLAIKHMALENPLFLGGFFGGNNLKKWWIFMFDSWEPHAWLSKLWSPKLPTGYGAIFHGYVK